jgi:hypothetical protein
MEMEQVSRKFEKEYPTGIAEPGMFIVSYYRAAKRVEREAPGLKCRNEKYAEAFVPIRERSER